MGRKTRILFVTHTLDFAAGGAERVLRDILQELDATRFEAFVAAPKPPIATLAQFENLPMTRLDLPRFYQGRSSEFYGRPDIRLIEICKTSLSLIILAAATMLAMRRISPDIVHINSIFSLYFCAPACILTKNSYVYHEHGLVSQRSKSLWSWFFRPLVVRASRIIANAAAARNELVTLGVDSRRIVVAHNGVRIKPSENLAPACTEAAIPRSPFRIVQIANLHRWKGHRTLVEAVAQLRASIPDVRVVIFGGGGDVAYAEELRRLIVQRGLRRFVELGGYVRGAGDMIRQFDCLVVASHGEPFGLVILEAMWAGVPVVATGAGGVPEIIEHEQNGLLFPPGDHHALAQCLRKVATDSGLRRRMISAGKRTVWNHFTTEIQTRKVEEVLLQASRLTR